MPEASFYSAFKDNMELMGLPCPESLFGNVTAATATIGALATAVKTFQTKATLAEVLMTFPTGAAAVGVATAVTELATLAGALSASFYLGACVGSLIVAAAKTYGPHAYGEISHVLAKVAKDLNTSIGRLLESVMRAHPIAAPMRTTAVVAGQYAR